MPLQKTTPPPLASWCLFGRDDVPLRLLSSAVTEIILLPPFPLFLFRQAMVLSLPSPNQKWAHSVCSHVDLKQALKNEHITSIETDILIGTHEHPIPDTADEVESTTRTSSLTNNEVADINGEVTHVENVAIMCHPPERKSCLSAEEFLEYILNAPKVVHMKLDFKEIEAVKPTLMSLVEKWPGSSSSLDQGCVYLNADVLPGPGKSKAGMDPDLFLQTCTDVISAKQELKDVSFYSLGWAVDCRAYGCYTDGNVDAMVDLIRRHELEDSGEQIFSLFLLYLLHISNGFHDSYKFHDPLLGIVLAVNARVLVKNCAPFDKFLSDFPSSQILVWTGSGEPPISKGKIDAIKNHFQLKDTDDRIGFDCSVRIFN